MFNFSSLLDQLHHDESGQDLVEYSLLGALMALGAVGSIKSMATGIAGVFTSVGSTISPSI